MVINEFKYKSMQCWHELMAIRQLFYIPACWNDAKLQRVPGNIVCYVSLLRQTVKLMEASSKSFLPSRKMKRVQGLKERTPHSPRWLPWANWAEAFAPPCAPRCVHRCCRQGPSGRQEITTGPQACRSLWWASAACSRTSVLGEEPFVCFKSKKHNLSCCIGNSICPLSLGLSMGLRQKIRVVPLRSLSFLPMELKHSCPTLCQRLQVSHMDSAPR